MTVLSQALQLQLSSCVDDEFISRKAVVTNFLKVILAQLLKFLNVLIYKQLALVIASTQQVTLNK